MNEETFLQTADTEKITSMMSQTQEQVKYFNDVSAETAKKYTSHLDSLMQEIYLKIKKSDDVDTDDIEHYYMELTNLLYFMGDKLEELGVHADMAKASAKEVYNRAYLESSAKRDEKGKSRTTVAENTSVAETASQYQTTVASIYDHAYKIVKYKIDGGYELVCTLKKILARRVAEISKETYYSSSAGNISGKKRLFEGD